MLGSQLSVTGNTGLFEIVNNILVGDRPSPAVACAPSPVLALPPIVRTNDAVASAGLSAFGDACLVKSSVNGNLSLDPMFVSTSATADNPFQLSLQSPAMDAGLSTAPDLPSEDILGNPRIQNAKGLASAIIDMGVYEYKGIAAPVNAADFTLGIDPSSLVIHSGQSETVAVTVTPNASFAGGVSLSCARLPTTLTCSFAPSIVSIAQATPGTATLTVSDVNPAAVSSTNIPGSGRRMALAIPGLFCFGVLLAGSRRVRARWRAVSALVGSAVLGLAISACGTTVIPGTLQTSQTVVVRGASGTGQLVRTASLRVSLN